MPLLTNSVPDQIGGLGESELIRRILKDLGSACPLPPMGPGDDTAVLGPTRQKRLLTADPVVCGQHFTADDPAARVAAKLIRRNLSDIAAMGGRPEAALLSMALSRDTSRRWIRDFIRAFGREARRSEVAVIGGDCTQTAGPPGFFVTLLGLSTGNRVLTRSGARAGDAVYVTGSLGGSRLGHQFTFKPRMAEGQWLAGRPTVHSMIDLSDGLAKDLPELVPAGMEALIDARAVPVSTAARKVSRSSGKSPLEHAFSDGEDFELLFTVSAKADPNLFERNWSAVFTTKLSRIGFIGRAESGGSAIRLTDAPKQFRLRPGYEHFA